MRHVVVDTNCLLRMIPVRSPYRSVWEAFLNEEYIICVSNDILSEYLEILTQKVSHTFAVRIVNALLKSNCIRFFDPHYHFGLIEQDPDDNKFVDCAIVASADYLVTEDKHFNVLKEIRFPQVRVVTLENFQMDLQAMGKR
ncbi:MAG: putative toxin-antitoxin system toxin component, PIN family [Prevotella sp.]|nr:putative toxin-antitoxin system toxin component, PIN family [Prevotella sp.]